VTLQAEGGSQAGEPVTTEASVAESALSLAERGRFEEAAERTRQGLQAVPSSSILNNLAGAILLLTGDRSGSDRVFGAVRQLTADSAIATYGMALSRLAAGDLDEADALIAGATVNGDIGACLLARQYIAFLRGARVAGSLALPADLDMARRGMEVAEAEASGDPKAALEQAERLLGDPKVGRYSDYVGVLMTFDRGNPVRLSGPPIHGPILPVRTHRAEAPASGTLMLKADDDDAAYVAFRVDGKFLAVANFRPFRLNWDTSTVPNGSHIVEVVAYDGRGEEIRRTRKEIVSDNANAPARETDRALEARLWKLLALRPSRASIASLASRAARRTGDDVVSSRWATLAMAIDPHVLPEPAPCAIRRGPSAPAFWRGDTDEKLVAITFDDGPAPGITERLLDTLVRESVPATFFVIGRHAADSPDLISKLAQAGMEIGNHSFSHPNLARATEALIREELLRTSACVVNITGTPPRWFRPPGGNLSDRVTRVAASLGMQACMWTVNGEHKELQGRNALVAQVLSQVRPGAVILLHNGRQPTVAALPVLIAELRRRGYRFVTVSELYARTRAVPPLPVLQ
jgi:peptidoglycan/xylan/chitin deacetylase (PgdA/CDA1 family)